jgi:hypothetical protein
MIIRKIIGLLVALVGILIGAALSVVSIIFMLAYWGAPENPGYEGTAVWIVAALIGVGIGYGMYKLGRKIAG